MGLLPDPKITLFVFFGRFSDSCGQVFGKWTLGDMPLISCAIPKKRDTNSACAQLRKAEKLLGRAFNPSIWKKKKNLGQQISEKVGFRELKHSSSTASLPRPLAASPAQHQQK